jgi:hypothetical protein
MFTLYDKDEMDDLSSDERKAFAKLLENEIGKRNGVQHETQKAESVR